MAGRPVLPPRGSPGAWPYRCEVRLRNGVVPGLAVRRRDCGQPAIGLFRSACACGLHVRERHACRECVTAVDGTCGLCWDEGHSCAVTITGPIGVLIKPATRSSYAGLMDTYVARHSPVTAVQWDGSNVREVAALLGIDPDDTALGIAAEMARQDGRLRVTYAGLAMAADRGEWYVRDSMGGVIVMPDSLFEASWQRQGEITR